MATNIKLYGHVLESSVTTGTGNFTLVNELGFEGFSNAAGTGIANKFYYGIRHNTASPTEWEEGTGYMLDATTLVRETVQRSSNADALVNFSAGDKVCVIDATSERQDKELVVEGTPNDLDVAQYDLASLCWLPVDPSTLSAFGKIYISPAQTIIPEGSLTLAHGLLEEPILKFVLLENVTGEYGYVTGDRLPAFLAVNSSSNNQGVSIISDATNLNIIYGAGSGGSKPVFSVIDRQAGGTLGNAQGITNGNWNAIFIAVTNGT